MSTSTFRALLILLAAGFAAAFAVIVVPPLIESGDIVGAFAAGFVNPYSSGYLLDTILCAAVLAVGSRMKPRLKVSGMAGLPCCSAWCPAWRRDLPSICCSVRDR